MSFSGPEALGFPMEQRVHVSMRTTPENAMQKTLEKIALDHFFIDTLETRKSDSLDFHEVSVWAVKFALEAAYRAGLEAAQKKASK